MLVLENEGLGFTFLFAVFELHEPDDCGEARNSSGY